jgi:DNA polymerase-3 subunit delta
MPNATPGAVRKQIAAGRPDAIYLLQGADEVEKSALAQEFEALVEAGLRPFNVERVQAADWTSGDRLSAGVAAIGAAVRTLPMMAPRRVVVVLHAETLLVPRRESEAATRALEAFEILLEQPDPQAVLVLVAAAIDRRLKVFKLLARQATIVDCGVLESVADAEHWVRNQVAARGVRIEPAAARLLAQRAGADIIRLRDEVDRLLLYALGQPTIGVTEARDVAGPSALQDDWGMPNAIEAGNGAEALRQLALLLDAGVPFEKILGQLAWLVRTKLPKGEPIRGAVDALLRTDLDLKRSAGEPRILLERLVVELCGTSRAAAPRSATWR